MFWSKKGKEKKEMAKREDAKAQALANARKARAEIGDENLQKLASMITGEMESRTKTEADKARARIKAMDKDKVVDNIRIMLDEKD
jgi:hypothetical protein